MDAWKWGARVSWDVANIYKYYVASNAVLREARDEIWDRNANNGDHRDEKIRLGNLYQSLRTADRIEFTEKVKEVLFDYCEDIVETPVKREKDVMNLACLVERKEALLLDRLDALDEKDDLIGEDDEDDEDGTK